MLKNKLFLFGLSCFLSVCSIFNLSNMHVYMIGKWIGEPLTETTDLQYVLKFLPFDILLADVKTKTETGHNFLFSYRFLNDNQVIINGRFLEKLDISKLNHNLIWIESEQGFIPTGFYRRASSANLYILFGLLLLGSLLSLTYRFLRRRRSAR